MSSMKIFYLIFYFSIFSSIIIPPVYSSIDDKNLETYSRRNFTPSFHHSNKTLLNILRKIHNDQIHLNRGKRNSTRHHSFYSTHGIYHRHYHIERNYTKHLSNLKYFQSFDLIIVNSKLVQHNKREKRFIFNISSSSVFFKTNDIKSLKIESVLSHEINPKKDHTHFYNYNEWELKSSYIYDTIDIAFMFGDEFKGPEILKVFDSWKKMIVGYPLIIISNELANNLSIKLPDWFKQFEIYSTKDIEDSFKMSPSPKFDLRNYANWVSKKEQIFIIGDSMCPFNHLPEKYFNTVISTLLFNLFSHVTQQNNNNIQEDLEMMAVQPMLLEYNDANKKWLERMQDKNQVIDEMFGFKLNENTVTVVAPNNIRFFFNMNAPTAYRRQTVGPMLTYFPPNMDTSSNYKNCKLKFSMSCEDIISGWILQILSETFPYVIKLGSPFGMVESINNSARNIFNNFDFENNIHSCNSSKLRLPEWYCEAKHFFNHYRIDRYAKYYNPKINHPNEFCYFSPHHKITMECLYTNLAYTIRSKLGKDFPFFVKLANYMLDWVNLYLKRNKFLGRMFPVSSRNMINPDKKRDLKGAVITISHDEKILLPRWLKYHLKHFDARDIFLFDHLTTDGSLAPNLLPPGINFDVLHGSPFTMPIGYRGEVITLQQDQLLRYGYKAILFCDVDEIVIPNPVQYPGGLSQYINEFIKGPREIVRVTAYELSHLSYGNGTKGTEELPLNWNISILKQRRYYSPDKSYNKPLLSKSPFAYRGGFHKLFDFRLDGTVPVDKDLVMFHLRSMDYEFCVYKSELKYNMSNTMEPTELYAGFANHWHEIAKLKAKGEFCQFAIGCFIGPHLGNQTKYWDNTGVYQLQVLEDYWQTIEL